MGRGVQVQARVRGVGSGREPSVPEQRLETGTGVHTDGTQPGWWSGWRRSGGWLPARLTGCAALLPRGLTGTLGSGQCHSSPEAAAARHLSACVSRGLARGPRRAGGQRKQVPRQPC